MNIRVGRIVLLLVAAMAALSCSREAAEPANSERRAFESSFESVDDFSGFYISPSEYLGTSFHELSDSIVHSGVFAHRAWIDGANAPSTLTTNNNHRAYPTVQFQKMPEGPLKTPCYVSLWVWLDMELQPDSSGGEDDWFSFATFTDDESDNWSRTVLVNLDPEGHVHLQHTSAQGEQTALFQTTSITFPQREWVELKMYLDFGESGYAKVWQNGELVSHANIENIGNKLSQAHFGLYCSPQLTSGTVYNDDLSIREVEAE